MDLKEEFKKLQITLKALLVLNAFTISLAATVCPGMMKFDVLRKECVCPTNMFYDQAVRLCTDCFEKCYNAELQGTDDECKSLCPEYQLQDIEMQAVETVDTKDMKCRGDMYFDKTFKNCTCPKEKYYDDVAQLCSECRVICLNSDIQKTTEVCKSLCPNYNLPSPTTSPPDSSSDLHKLFVIIIVIVAATVVICLICVVILVACYCRGKVQTFCSMMCNQLPLETENRTGDEVNQDKFNEEVQIAIKDRPAEAWDNTQPHDKEEAGPIIPSGSAVEVNEEETQAKVALLRGTGA